MDSRAHREDAAPGRSGRRDQEGPGPSRDHTRTLEHFATERQAILTEGWLDNLAPRKGGNEHDTFADPSRPGWRIKVTAPALAHQDGRPRIPPISEADYLKRWLLSNIVFGDKAEFMGVIRTDKGSRLVIQQPEVEATSHLKPYPAGRQDINDWLRAAGFEYEDGAWVRDADGIVVSDDHESNFIKTQDGLRPIDLNLRQLESKKGVRVIP